MSPPITNHHITLPQLPPLPDLLLTALSVCFLSSSSAAAAAKPLILRFPFCPRRLRKISTMSLPHHHPRRHHFANPQSLSDWLKSRLPSDSFASWGVKPGTKNVHNLWLELSEGETSLADSSPPVRTVQVVTVRIRDGCDRILIESHQELSDGSVRSRDRPLSEKMKPFEDVQSAAARAVREELGSIVDGAVRIVPGSYRKKVEERNSVSYPGLPARYELHSVEAVVEGLPDGEFCTVEAEEYEDCESTRIAEEAVSVKKHFWRWFVELVRVNYPPSAGKMYYLTIKASNTNFFKAEVYVNLQRERKVCSVRPAVHYPNVGPKFAKYYAPHTSD